MRYGWTKEDITWNEISPILNMKWKTFSFHSNNHTLIKKSTRGVYMFLGKYSISKENEISSPLYIGRAICIRSRFKDHLNKNKYGRKIQKLNLKCFFSYLPLEGQTINEITHIEDSLIETFGPVYNKRRERVDKLERADILLNVKFQDQK